MRMLSMEELLRHSAGQQRLRDSLASTTIISPLPSLSGLHRSRQSEHHRRTHQDAGTRTRSQHHMEVKEEYVHQPVPRARSDGEVVSNQNHVDTYDEAKTEWMHYQSWSHHTHRQPRFTLAESMSGASAEDDHSSPLKYRHQHIVSRASVDIEGNQERSPARYGRSFQRPEQISDSFEMKQEPAIHDRLSAKREMPVDWHSFDYHTIPYRREPARAVKHELANRADVFGSNEFVGPSSAARRYSADRRAHDSLHNNNNWVEANKAESRPSSSLSMSSGYRSSSSASESQVTTNHHSPRTDVDDVEPREQRLRSCIESGCTKSVADRGRCVRHGGGKRCYVEGCNCRAQNRGLCWKHGGYTICKVEGCSKRAKSRGICWSHGGGTRCKQENCTKIAVSIGLCWAHGGVNDASLKIAASLRQSARRTIAASTS